MIYGILGTIQDRAYQPTVIQRPSDCGNGKTTALTHILYQEFVQKDRKVIANFHTRFPGAPWGSPTWSEYRTAQEIFDIWLEVDEDHPDFGAIIGITEIESILNSAAREGKVIKHIEKCLNQRRKNEWDIAWDSQVLGSADKRWRQKTDFLYHPEKWHCAWSPEYECFIPTEPCPLDICHERHQILIYQEYPLPPSIEEMLKPVMILNSWEVGQLIDTREKMKDTIHFNPAWEHQE